MFAVLRAQPLRPCIGALQKTTLVCSVQYPAGAWPTRLGIWHQDPRSGAGHGWDRIRSEPAGPLPGDWTAGCCCSGWAPPPGSSPGPPYPNSSWSPRDLRVLHSFLLDLDKWFMFASVEVERPPCHQSTLNPTVRSTDDYWPWLRFYFLFPEKNAATGYVSAKVVHIYQIFSIHIYGS
jgi:hypothetical protein